MNGMQPINFPLTGNSLIMAIFILVHVFFAFVAVGGIAISFATEWIGYKNKNPYYDRFAKGYIKFISEMMKLGGVLGVAIIVLLIGLFPEFTKQLYNIFFWPLILEVCTFFLLMGSTIYYKLTWDLSTNKPKHIAVGGLATLSAVVSAVIINAAHAFMLTPGIFFEEPTLKNAVFNPSMLVSSTHLLIPCIINAALFAFFYSFYKLKRREDADYYSWSLQYTAKISAFAILLQPLSGLSFLFKLRAIDMNIFNKIVAGNVSTFFWPMAGLGIFALLCSVIYLIGKGRRPVILAFGGMAVLVAFSFGGYTRERARKPYLIYNHLYMGEAFAADTTQSAPQGKATVTNLLSSRGCLACHKYNKEGGTFAVDLAKHLKHHSKEELKQILKNPPESMPPFKGTDEELIHFVDGLKANQ